MTSFLTVIAVLTVAVSQCICGPLAVEDRLTFDVRPRMSDPNLGQSVVVDCEAWGSPSPVIHWLFNGQRIKQGSEVGINQSSPSVESSNSPVVESGAVRPSLKLGWTWSRLFLDSLRRTDEGEYTCVASTPRQTITASTSFHIKPSEMAHIMFKKRVGSSSVVPARIFMWTAKRLEFEGTDVQLFCRAQGSPTPVIRWYDPLDAPVMTDSQQYQILSNGDLLIKSVNWADNMGLYRCVADNFGGQDEVSTFLYPTTM